jgi:hypothetical protein
MKTPILNYKNAGYNLNYIDDSKRNLLWYMIMGSCFDIAIDIVNETNSIYSFDESNDPNPIFFLILNNILSFQRIDNQNEVISRWENEKRLIRLLSEKWPELKKMSFKNTSAYSGFIRINSNANSLTILEVVKDAESYLLNDSNIYIYGNNSIQFKIQKERYLQFLMDLKF